MLRTRINSIVRTGLLSALLCLAPAAVRAAEISDGGKFFSAEALTTANQSIRDLEKKSGHEIRIETFAFVPADKIEAVGKMDAKQRGAFFSKWVFDRAEATKSRGIVVLICREPSHLNVWAGSPLQKAGFGVTQAKAVEEVLLARLKAKEYDKGLTEAVAQLSTTFGGLSHAKAKASTTTPVTHESKHVGHVTPTSPARAPAHQAPVQVPQQSNWTSVGVVLMFVVGGIIVISLISRLFGGGRSSGAGGYGSGGYGNAGGGGGGGFMSGLTGGIFGAMAGNWMYDQFSGRHASGGETHSSGDSLGSNDSSSSSGPDSGSSDSGFDGGTDFGGGDFGGGGDSSGGSDFGGGGDF